MHGTCGMCGIHRELAHRDPNPVTSAFRNQNVCKPCAQRVQPAKEQR